MARLSLQQRLRRLRSRAVPAAACFADRAMLDVSDSPEGCVASFLLLEGGGTVRVQAEAVPSKGRDKEPCSLGTLERPAPATTIGWP